MKNLFLSLRPKQWVKNLFIFLPLIFAGKLFVFPTNLKAAMAFLLFCLISGSVYIINDIIDFKKDKLHPLKRLRPIASGKLSKIKAIVSALTISILSVGFSFWLSIFFGWIIIAYILFNLLYSLSLKKAVIIDVFCISGFFLLRIWAGSAVADAQMSYWIIIVTALLALFLGFNKRRQELKMLKGEIIQHRQVLNKYSSYFIDQMIAVITSSIVVTYMLYTVDARTVQEFGTRNLLFSVPFVYYGIFRYLYLIHISKIDGDPTNILFKDRKLQFNLFLWIVICIFVIYFK